MMLVDSQLRKLRRTIFPRGLGSNNSIADKQFQPASVDLRLGKHIKWLPPENSRAALDPYQDEIPWRDHYLAPGERWNLEAGPDGFILATTSEWVEIPPNLSGVVNGKSTLARCGVQVHATAGFLDPGFKGTITLEISALGRVPIALREGMMICQLHFLQNVQVPERLYGDQELGSRYQLQKGTTASRKVPVDGNGTSE